jgi:hypothetical protein
MTGTPNRVASNSPTRSANPNNLNPSPSRSPSQAQQAQQVHPALATAQSSLAGILPGASQVAPQGSLVQYPAASNTFGRVTAGSAHNVRATQGANLSANLSPNLGSNLPLNSGNNQNMASPGMSPTVPLGGSPPGIGLAGSPKHNNNFKAPPQAGLSPGLPGPTLGSDIRNVLTTGVAGTKSPSVSPSHAGKGSVNPMNLGTSTLNNANFAQSQVNAHASMGMHKNLPSSFGGNNRMNNNFGNSPNNKALSPAGLTANSYDKAQRGIQETNLAHNKNQTEKQMTSNSPSHKSASNTLSKSISQNNNIGQKPQPASSNVTSPSQKKDVTSAPKNCWSPIAVPKKEAVQQAQPSLGQQAQQSQQPSMNSVANMLAQKVVGGQNNAGSNNSAKGSSSNSSSSASATIKNTANSNTSTSKASESNSASSSLISLQKELSGLHGTGSALPTNPGTTSSANLSQQAKEPLGSFTSIDASSNSNVNNAQGHGNPSSSAQPPTNSAGNQNPNSIGNLSPNSFRARANLGGNYLNGGGMGNLLGSVNQGLLGRIGGAFGGASGRSAGNHNQNYNNGSKNQNPGQTQKGVILSHNLRRFRNMHKFHTSSTATPAGSSYTNSTNSGQNTSSNSNNTNSNSQQQQQHHNNHNGNNNSSNVEPPLVLEDPQLQGFLKESIATLLETRPANPLYFLAHYFKFAAMQGDSVTSAFRLMRWTTRHHRNFGETVREWRRIQTFIWQWAGTLLVLNNFNSSCLIRRGERCV